jgi:hypothetical protein
MPIWVELIGLDTDIDRAVSLLQTKFISTESPLKLQKMRRWIYIPTESMSTRNPKLAS